MEEEKEILFEAWVEKLCGVHNKKQIKLPPKWSKRYLILRRVKSSSYLEYYKKKPFHGKENISVKMNLTPHYRIEKKEGLYDRAYVCVVITETKQLTIALEESKIFHLFTFFIQTQTRLKEQYEGECFRIRPENSEDHRLLGARGNMCCLHVSPYGLTLVLEVSKCILAQWPLKCIRSYEVTGKGQFALEAGIKSPCGPGRYVFNTRYGQDNVMYNMLDNYVNQALERQHINPDLHSLASERANLHSYTCAESNPSSIVQLRRISRDIYDHLSQHIGGSTRLGSSRSDLLEVKFSQSRKSSESRSEIHTPPVPPSRVILPSNNQLHQTPPPDYHQYNNDDVEVPSPPHYMAAGDPLRSLSMVEVEYLHVNPKGNMRTSNLSQSTMMSISSTATQSTLVSRESKVSQNTSRSRDSNASTLVEEPIPKAGVTASLPRPAKDAQSPTSPQSIFSSPGTSPSLPLALNPQLRSRLSSRSMDDLGDPKLAHLNMGFAYNNRTFEDADGYSLATPVSEYFGSGSKHRRSVSNPNLLMHEMDSFQVNAVANQDRSQGWNTTGRPNKAKLKLDFNVLNTKSSSQQAAPTLPPARPAFAKLQGPQIIRSPTNVEGINITQHTKSFKKPKPVIIGNFHKDLNMNVKKSDSLPPGSKKERHSETSC